MSRSESGPSASTSRARSERACSETSWNAPWAQSLPPPLSPGWFTQIALTEPDAVHLFSLGSEPALVACGILDRTAPGLAVVASRAGTPQTLEAFGDEDVSRRLVRLIESREPVQLSDLAIAAIPAVGPKRPVRNGALATLLRPNFTFVVGRR